MHKAVPAFTIQHYTGINYRSVSKTDETNASRPQVPGPGLQNFSLKWSRDQDSGFEDYNTGLVPSNIRLWVLWDGYGY